MGTRPRDEDRKKPYKPRNNSPNQLAQLKTFADRDPEELREISRKGGLACQKQARERRKLRQTVEWLLDQPAFATNNDAVNALREQFPDLTNGEAMSAAVIAKTINEGDAKNFTVLRDTIGEAPVYQNNLPSEPITINIKTVD